MRRVVIESPFAGVGDTYAERYNDGQRRLEYLRACMADCLRRGESPYASHGLYTQPGVLDDAVPAERALGIRAGFAWRDVADATVVYADLGITGGMEAGIADAKSKGRPIEYRMLGERWAAIAAEVAS